MNYFENITTERIFYFFNFRMLFSDDAQQTNIGNKLE